MSANEACPAWQEAISAFLDGCLASDEEHAVHAHLRQCGLCARYLVDLVPIVQALRAWPQAAPGHDLWPAIALELARDPLFGASRWRVLAPARLPRSARVWVAAGLIGAVGLGSWLMQQPGTPTPVADVGLYWQQHETFSRDEALPTMYAPQLKAIQASYQLAP